MKLKYLVLSDIHFGSNQNKTASIISHLYTFFITYKKELKGLDLIIIAGDIFDKLLSSASIDYIAAIEWLTNIVKYCKHNNIKLRILEGTPSHDSKQANVINVIIKKLDLDVDFKYIDNIYIEHIKDYNIDILYVPDEIRHTASLILKDINKLMEEKYLNKVDIAIMHGAFKYQIPVIELPSMHDEQVYLKLVKHFISIGHIHTSSAFKRILAQGSFDRLAHNEEEAKGAMLIIIDTNDRNNDSFIFLENTVATIFKSITITETEILTAINAIRDILIQLPFESHIRLILHKGNPILKSMLDIYNKFPKYNFSSPKIVDDTVDKTDSELKNILQNGETKSIQINKSNIEELLLEEISYTTLDNDIKKIISTELSNII